MRTTKPRQKRPPRSTTHHNTKAPQIVPSTVVGHRGNGAVNLNVNGAGKDRGRVRARENSMRAFLQAAERGADFVEFDVLLTRDNVPVIFHDFDVCVQSSDRSTKLDEVVAVPFALLSSRQLHSLRIKENSFGLLKNLVMKHWGAIVKRKSKSAFAIDNSVTARSHTMLRIKGVVYRLV